MTLLEYIKMSHLRPNRAVLKGLGANNELIKYLMETPNNTNMVVVESLIDGATGEVIFDGEAAATYNNRYTSVGGELDSDFDTSNIKVGTTFIVELNDDVYHFVIATVDDTEGSRQYASEGFSQPLSFGIYDGREGLMCAIQIEDDVRPITHFKVIQTSDYEEPSDEPSDEPASKYPIQDFKVTTLPDKTQYAIGDALDLTDMVVTIYWNDGTSEVLESKDYDVFPAAGTIFDTAGTVNVEVWVSAQIGEISDTFNIRVYDNDEPVSISVAPPVKQVYHKGEQMSLGGMGTFVDYIDGQSQEVNPQTSIADGEVLTQAGEIEVTVSYGGCSTSFTITVYDGPFHLSVDLNGGTWTENEDTVVSIDQDYYEDETANVSDIISYLKAGTTSPAPAKEIGYCTTVRNDASTRVDTIAMTSNKTVYAYWIDSEN